MLTVIIFCIAMVFSVFIIANADVHITITRDEAEHSDTFGTNVAESLVEQAYKELEKDPVPTFTDVINVINKEFGGVDYEE